MRFFDSDKSKRKEKPKRRSYRRAVIGSALLFILLIAGVIILRRRFNPMLDVPDNNLIINWKNGSTYTLDSLNFQTGERTPTTVPRRPNPYYPPSPDGHWWAHWVWVKQYTDSALMLDDLTEQESSRSLGTFYGADATLSWSADNKWLAFTAYDPSIDMSNGAHAAEIWMIQIETGELKRLTQNTTLDSDPYFSPDGTQLAYMSTADGYPRVYVMDLASSESRLLTPDQYGDKPKWSPDGQWIAFEAASLVYEGDRAYDAYNSYIIRIDGTHGQLLTREGGSVWGWETE
jgi:dipeptidyl aminopeptidase/acylaminoacyl peptidase